MLFGFFYALNLPNFYDLDYHNGWYIFRGQVKFTMLVWDIVISFKCQIEITYIPSILFGGLHIALLAYNYLPAGRCLYWLQPNRGNEHESIIQKYY